MKIQAVFPTAIGTAKNDQILLDKDRLLETLIWRDGSRARRQSGPAKWQQSQTNLHEYPEWQPLLGWIKTQALEYWHSLGWKCEDLWFTQAWMNCMNDGGTIASHIHANSLISGAYYFRVGEHAGPTVFENPRDPYTRQLQTDWSHDTEFNQFEIFVPAQEDYVVFFPSDLKHRSAISQAPTTRYTLAFNLLPTTLGVEHSFNLAALR